MARNEVNEGRKEGRKTEYVFTYLNTHCIVAVSPGPRVQLSCGRIGPARNFSTEFNRLTRGALFPRALGCPPISECLLEQRRG